MLHEQNQKLLQKIKKYEKINTELQEEHDSSIKELIEEQQKVIELQEKCEQLLEQHKTTSKQYEDKINEEQQKISDLQQNLENYQKQNQSAMNQYEDKLNEESKKASELSQNLHSIKEEHKSTLKQFEEKISEEQQKVNNLEQSLKGKNTELVDVKNKLANAEQKIEQKEAQIKQIQQQNTKLQSQRDELQLQLQQSQQNKIEKLFGDLSLSQCQGESTEVQVQSILKQLNPQTEIQNQQVQFAMAFQSVTQNQPTENQQMILQDKNNSLVSQLVGNSQKPDQNQESGSKNNQLSQKQKDIMQCILVLQSMYKQDGITTFITDSPISSLEKDNHYKIQQSYLQTGLHNSTFFFSLQINEGSALFSKLRNTQNEQDLQNFIQNFKQDVGSKIGLENPKQDIVLFNVACHNTPQIDFKIDSQKFTKEQLKKMITFDDIGLSLSQKSLLQFAKLSVEMFNPQFNYEWPLNKKGEYETRGQLKFFNQDTPIPQKYNFPGGYKGFALNIDRYGSDKSWISKNSDEYTWIVLFHGTRENAIEGIMAKNLLPGQRNAYGGKLCRITNQVIKNGDHVNVYLTDEIDIAEHYASSSQPYEGKKYKIVFQCRVNPKAVRSPVGQPRYYTVEDNSNIRPYRILLKEVI